MSPWLVVLLTLAAVMVVGTAWACAIDKDAREYLTGFLVSPLILGGAVAAGLMARATGDARGPRRARVDAVERMLASPDSRVDVLLSSPRWVYMRVRYVPEPDEGEAP